MILIVRFIDSLGQPTGGPSSALLSPASWPDYVSPVDEKQRCINIISATTVFI